ncbi:hypothetical protein HPB49_015382 [Dermacentor silvarum]|uniref:Uncharacterized protein n=1 Tax=Dermacentor silvarum TaxID=543639 RepID=A0ACB8DJD9_DERSI|nr:hypothetical protein HPB49_015382 [Dermacentor silvarum]
MLEVAATSADNKNIQLPHVSETLYPSHISDRCEADHQRFGSNYWEAEQVSYAHLIDFALVGFLAAIWAIMPTDGIAVVTHWFFEKVVSLLLRLPYSRKLELEADEVGLQLAAKACFDVREASAFWTKMSLMGSALDDVEFISTHPSHEHRSEYLDNLMNNAIELRRQCHCPRLPPQDPRVLMSMLKEEVKQESLAKQGIVVLQPPR